jgi:predicted amidohydrolase YtcJ
MSPIWGDSTGLLLAGIAWVSLMYCYSTDVDIKREGSKVNPEILVFAGAPTCGAGPADSGDVPSGTILSMDAAGTRYEAIAVRGGLIIAAGDLAEVESAVAAAQEAAHALTVTCVELGDRVLMPGINDSHLHATWLGARWPSLLFGDDEHEAPRSPLCVSREERRTAILRANRLLAAVGITSYTEPGIGPGEDGGETGCFGSDVIEIYRELAEQEALMQRVTLLGLHGVLDGPSDVVTVSEGIARQAGEDDPTAAGSPNLFVRTGVKIFADLIPLSRNAWTSHEYIDGTHGGLLVEGADPAEQEANLRAMIRAAQFAGQQIGVHATGDRAIEAVLSELEQFDPDEVRALAHTIIHGDLATECQVRRMADLGIWFNVQSGIAAITRDWLRAVLPAEAVDRAWPIAEALESGNLVLSSDSPILGFDWREGIAHAEAVLRAAGHVPDRYQLLRAYTAVPAMQDRAASWKGTIEPGKAADLVLLSGDPSRGDVREVEVEATYLSGREVWARGAAAAALDPREERAPRLR